MSFVLLNSIDSWTDNIAESEDCSVIDNFDKGNNYNHDRGYAIDPWGSGYFFQPLPGGNKYKFICKIGVSVYWFNNSNSN